ncbi:MAG: hypothetical protein SFU86_09140 [Pirellulaceae bacterium]|nr:hypothetical protein [Pirellulaceae bacterium]
MPANHQHNGDTYLWQLDLPPVGVAALLSAVCVHQSANATKREYYQQLFWGSKSWTIQFDGKRFQLAPLGHNRSFHLLFGPQLGSLAAVKSGTQVCLEFASTAAFRRSIRLFMGGGTALFAFVCTFFVTAALPLDWAWIAWPLRVLTPAWFAAGFGWFHPRTTERAPVEFLDEVFAAHVVPPSHEEYPATKPLAVPQPKPF